MAELINYLGGDLEFTAEFGLIYVIARMGSNDIMGLNLRVT